MLITQRNLQPAEDRLAGLDILKSEIGGVNEAECIMASILHSKQRFPCTHSHTFLRVHMQNNVAI